MRLHLNVLMKMIFTYIYLHLHLYTLLYADDTIIMAESEQHLQTALDAVFSFCKLWYLELNISKTKVIIFFERQS